MNYSGIIALAITMVAFFPLVAASMATMQSPLFFILVIIWAGVIIPWLSRTILAKVKRSVSEGGTIEITSDYSRADLALEEEKAENFKEKIKEARINIPENISFMEMCDTYIDTKAGKRLSEDQMRVVYDFGYFLEEALRSGSEDDL